MTARSDVIVIGAGPAGSTAANLLAQAGIEVTVLEKASFPRFHIGESLLPCDLPLFERLGFSPDRTDYLFKRGAEFIDERTNSQVDIPFTDGLTGTPRHAWQVERARFDHALIKLASARGARVRFEEKVLKVNFGGEDGVEVETERARFTARYAVDATGQDALLARKNKTVTPLKGFGRGAVFCHFEGLNSAAREALHASGNIKILILEDGWAWVIPLKTKLSVGLVSNAPHLRACHLNELILRSPLLTRLTEGASQTEPQLIRNFSFQNQRAHGARFCCVGDAACFLDPVFSSGVSLAMLGAERLADTLVPALREGTEAAPELMTPLKAQMRQGYEAFGSLIKAFYSSKLLENLFFYDSPDPQVRAGLISLLAGDVWRDDNAFQNALMKGRRRWLLPD